VIGRESANGPRTDRRCGKQRRFMATIPREKSSEAGRGMMSIREERPYFTFVIPSELFAPTASAAGGVSLQDTHISVIDGFREYPVS